MFYLIENLGSSVYHIQEYLWNSSLTCRNVASIRFDLVHSAAWVRRVRPFNIILQLVLTLNSFLCIQTEVWQSVNLQKQYFTIKTHPNKGALQLHEKWKNLRRSLVPGPPKCSREYFLTTKHLSGVYSAEQSWLVNHKPWDCKMFYWNSFRLQTNAVVTRINNRTKHWNFYFLLFLTF